MSKSYGKKNNKIFSIVLTIVSLILVISGIGVLYNHFEDDIQFLFKDEIQVIEGIEDGIKESEIPSSKEYMLTAGPFVYQDLDLYENMRITKVGIPVKTLTDCTKDQVFTLYLVEGDGTKNFEQVKKYELVIEADTYKSNTVNKWHYSDVKDLKIEVGEGQTLAFTSVSDTVIPGFKENLNTYVFYSGIFTSNKKENSSSIYIDVYGYELDK